MTPSDATFSQRANEVAEDLFVEIAATSGAVPLEGIKYHLDGSDTMLDYQEAVRWVKESVDAGYPGVRHYYERKAPHVVVNLAAFEDPDSQFHEPA